MVDTLIQRYQHDPAMHEVESSQVTVEGMEHRFLLVHEMDKVRVAAAISRGVARTMMFTRTKRAADRLARELTARACEAAAIHGDLRQRERERALANFGQGELHVLVATDVAARGIHVDDVDVVVHYDPPEDHKNYLHRSGRTARAGESGVVATLLLWNEELEIKRVQRRLGIDQPHRRGVLERQAARRPRRLGPGRRGRRQQPLSGAVACPGRQLGPVRPGPALCRNLL